MNDHSASSNHLPVVIHLPDKSMGNPYQRLLQSGIEENGWQVQFSNYPRGLMPLQSLLNSKRDIEAIHLHWIAPYIGRLFWTDSFVRFYAKSAILFADMLCCRLRGRRLIWTVHNQLSHESRQPSKEKMLRRFIALASSHLIFHSCGARDKFQKEVTSIPAKKSSVIPHGNYIGVYPVDASKTLRLKQLFDLKDSDIVILFIGAIRRYKGVSRLVRAFQHTKDQDLKLIIAGKPFEESLQEELEDAARIDERIRLYLSYIPDNEIAPLLEIADLVALPFEKTLTSGSVLLAASYGIPVALPESARSLDVLDDQSAFFFDSDGDLITLLSSMDKQQLKIKGRNCLEVAKKLNWNDIGRKTASLYR